MSSSKQTKARLKNDDDDEGETTSSRRRNMMDRSQLVSQRTMDWTTRKSPGSSVGDALLKNVKSSPQVHAGIKVNKITYYGKYRHRILTISNDYYAIFVTHGKVSASQSNKGVLSTIAATLKTPLMTRKGWSKRDRYVRYIDVADVDYIQTNLVGTYKLECARGNAKNRLRGQVARIDREAQHIVTIFHHGNETLDVVVKNEAVGTVLVQCLQQMMATYKQAQQFVGNEELLLRYIWYDIDVTNDGVIQEAEFVKLTNRINLYVKGSPAKLYKTYLTELKNKNLNNKGMDFKNGLTYHESMCLLQRIKSGHYADNEKDTMGKLKSAATTATRKATKTKKKKRLSTLPAMELWDAVFGPETTHVSAEEFLQKFLVERQSETSVTLKEVQSLLTRINRMELNREDEVIQPNHISKIRFEAYLMTAMNDAYDPAAQVLNKTSLIHPMSHYWINTSHNTYLMGDQLRSTSSVGMYMESLRRGCKCLELDCWDGETSSSGEAIPVVYHGHTLTSKIVFGDIICGVKAYVNDHPDTYPIILSLENHCSHPFQESMAKILNEQLGDVLYTPFANKTSKQEDEEELLPSPESLRGRVIIKGKRPPELDDEEEDAATEQDDEDPYEDTNNNSNKKTDDASKPKPPKIVKELARMTLFHGTKFKSFDKSIELPTSHMHSIGETKITKILGKAPENAALWRKYNVRHMTRTYPAGTRVDSSNYNPIVAWSMGCQLVALNFQTNDAPLLLNDGRFRQNGGCGYVLKPNSVMGTRAVVDTPTEPTVVSIKVLSGSCLPKPSGAKEGETIDPYVQVTLHDVAVDTKTETESYATDNCSTPSVSDSGFCPIWSEVSSKFQKQFTVHNMDVAMMQFSLWEADVDLDDKVADATIPLSCLRKGVRSIQLYDSNGTRTGPFGFATLLVEIDY